MLYDLNIPCPSGQQLDQKTVNKLKLSLSRLTQLSPYTVALNQTVEASNLSRITLKKIDTSAFSDQSTLNSRYPLHLLHRITITTNESLKELEFSKFKQSYDLVAVRTNNLAVFKECCEIYDIDIIALDCTERLTFELNPSDITKAMSRNVYFELCYSNAIRDHQQARLLTLQLGKQLAEYTKKGQHLIISSEAESVSELRSSGDIFYLYVEIDFNQTV
ncbi:RNase P subunit p30-domain-containing protein [Mycotypha africana]|uniref:RNase P subunit p30-domain-containing protein n=1 Tax=Mycotypha africana TaxID=64632 RepID=UPI0023005F72|nr:RNase P subunit p30-domain-containing protein [Mycotypha africana]KAI8977603.1 RNase P subunit p30-domain-containing protein [Mycotypha africana]